MNPSNVADEVRASHPQITVTRHVFSLVCRVEVNIRATAPAIWRILTDAKDFPRWNSTITGIDGARLLPDFGRVFANFADDRKREAERSSARANVG